MEQVILEVTPNPLVTALVEDVLTLVEDIYRCGRIVVVGDGFDQESHEIHILHCGSKNSFQLNVFNLDLVVLRGKSEKMRK